MVCNIVIYLISIVASPALIKTVAPCRRLYCKPVWSFVSPPPPRFLDSVEVWCLHVQFLWILFIFPVFLFYSHPENPSTSAQIFLLLQLHRTPHHLQRSEWAVNSRLLLLLWWLLQLILNLKNEKRKHWKFSKWASEEVLGINQTLVGILVAWRETDRVKVRLL